ncbi:T9SS C-terminal target domain-containing protein [Chryseobacterium sp. G0162]|uniref:T9SS type A sorting domain-containing protein n=1 Tax=Chryseobacterium sp. G0162 TaxID=2487063 RepID=UPI000F4E5A48|nr:T9SS type A sorting domain-containing protein [Chryseobacterium sp. G0162]AZB11471.1 T9SS C-terminal target domain-containing protein [Chryseobacterium sp. G0162]
MKKIMLSAAIMACSFMFAQQITLEHTFPISENVDVFPNGNDIIFVAKGNGNTINIYNSSYVLVKTVNVPIPSGYIFEFYPSSDTNFQVTKHIFNNDDKLEFVVSAKILTNQQPSRKLYIVNEDGTIIKDFTTNPNTSWTGDFNIFHNNASNTNKIIITNVDNNDNLFREVYTLPSTTLSVNEIQSKGKQLSAFPIPANKVLNIINPSNGSSTVTIYDMTGKQVINKSFGSMDHQVSVNVESLPKGSYFYKIGEASSKFIKN